VTLFWRLGLALACLAVTLPADAQDSSVIIQARAAGIVGERYDGYLGYSDAANEQVRRQVGAVNIKRRVLYTDLASRKRATVQEVGIAAGCQLLGGVRAGERYMLNDGAWRTRGGEEAAPVPSYCAR
jgi:uncharacterized protein YdbL (DUF1318 family)